MKKITEGLVEEAPVYKKNKTKPIDIVYGVPPTEPGGIAVAKVKAGKKANTGKINRKRNINKTTKKITRRRKQ